MSTLDEIIKILADQRQPMKKWSLRANRKKKSGFDYEISKKIKVIMDFHNN